MAKEATTQKPAQPLVTPIIVSSDNHFFEVQNKEEETKTLAVIVTVDKESNIYIHMCHAFDPLPVSSSDFSEKVFDKIAELVQAKYPDSLFKYPA
mgnify:CR=1 FL=1